MASNPQSSFALRPLPYGDRKPKNLGEFIARINAERGGFRSVTEETLRKEIETQDNGVEDSKDVDMDVESDDEADSNLVKFEEIHEAVDEVHKNAEYVTVDEK